MKIYKVHDARQAQRAGYSARYIADIDLVQKIDSAGVILVDIPKGIKTAPHSHANLEEVFIIFDRTRMGVDGQIIELEAGDVVIVGFREKHWFETYPDNDVRVVAIKLPNLTDDKIE